MARAKKCDRCGAFYEEPKSENKNELSIIQPTKGGGYYDLDLCDVCIAKLKAFLKGAELNDNR